MNGPHRQQRTLACPTRVDGFGFWSGQDVQVEFRPAPENSGIVFVRHDRHPAVRIPAAVQHRVESPRRTTLRNGSVEVAMVEHVLAALAGLQIDNCEVWVDAPEMPGVDGSSLPFVTALRDAGTVSQAAMRPYLIVSEVLRVGDDDAWIEARPVRDRAMSIQYRLDYGPDHPIGRETLRLAVTPERFLREVAPARTFIQRDEAEWLRAQGLAQRVSPQDVLIFDDRGLMDNELRLENECVAHKVLDMIGDLSLSGCDLIGQFVAHRSGHRLNALMVEALRTEFRITHEWKVSA